MFFTSWEKRNDRPTISTNSKRRQAGLCRPTLEEMEDRWMPAPVANQIVPVAVYVDTPGAFGAAYDSTRNLMWYSQLSGNNPLRSLKPFSAFTAAEIAALPNVGGILQISTTAGEEGMFTTMTPGGTSGGALGYDVASDRLVLATTGNVLHAFTPVTGANADLMFREGPPDQSPFMGGDIGLIDGLDIDGANTWSSPDIGRIYKNGVLFADPTNPAQLVSTTDGAVANQSSGWAGVEQIGGRAFAVAPLSNGDRTIVQFDANTGEFLFFDPDGDPIAARFEDLAFDGRYLYCADLNGDFNMTGAIGDIYVFDISGPGGLVQTADLVLTKTDSADPVMVGQNLTYTLRVTNNGPDPAPDVVLTDTLPGGVVFVSATASQGSVTHSGGVVTGTLGTLANGATATVTIVVTVQREGTLNNTAQVQSSITDPVVANSSATQSTTVRRFNKVTRVQLRRVAGGTQFTITVDNSSGLVQKGPFYIAVSASIRANARSPSRPRSVTSVALSSSPSIDLTG